MKILAISKDLPGANWDGAEQILQEEARVLHQLYLSNQVREMYFTGQDDAMLILESPSPEEALDLLQQLPLVRLGMIGFEVTELRPYTGFSRLF
jgi:hypothetical protein